VDREGGSFFQEWSGLFVLVSETGGRILYHYPRLQAATPAQETKSTIAGSCEGWSLRASLIALPTKDVNDSEQVLCYRTYLPTTTAALY
jgi:hypothetical protein